MVSLRPKFVRCLRNRRATYLHFIWASSKARVLEFDMKPLEIHHILVDLEQPLYEIADKAPEGVDEETLWQAKTRTTAAIVSPLTGLEEQLSRQLEANGVNE